MTNSSRKTLLAAIIFSAVISFGNKQATDAETVAIIEHTAVISEETIPIDAVLEIAEEDKTYSGEATYYHDKLHGKKTASGELYDKNDFTSAVKLSVISVEFGTIVEVYNVATDKKVLVKVNDRMGKSARAIIDLSRAAAEEIGLIAAGRAQVVVRVLGQDSTSVALYNLAHERL